MWKRYKPRLLKFWSGVVRPFLVVLIVVGSFRSAVADWNDVPTGSMKPTIVEGDRIFVNKLAYTLRVPFTHWHVLRWAEPARGDVVVLFAPPDDVRLVKRVVGLPGDRIEMRNNRLFVNGEVATYEPLLDTGIVNQLPPEERKQHGFAWEKIDGNAHPVLSTPGLVARRSFQALTVPPDHYFVMGDNRDESRDSRWFGFVESGRIVGRAQAVVFSFDPEHHYLPRWHRFFRGLP